MTGGRMLQRSALTLALLLSVAGEASAEVSRLVVTARPSTTLTLRSVYPNPSRDIFNFSFILSGNVLPDDFSLQIYSYDGKLLQQFGMNDIGNFIIGMNELPWNATQANITNGLFVYRLTMRVDGKNISQHGKLVLAQ